MGLLSDKTVFDIMEVNLDTIKEFKEADLIIVTEEAYFKMLHELEMQERYEDCQLLKENKLNIVDNEK